MGGGGAAFGGRKGGEIYPPCDGCLRGIGLGSVALALLDGCCAHPNRRLFHLVRRSIWFEPYRESEHACADEDRFRELSHVRGMEGDAGGVCGRHGELCGDGAVHLQPVPGTAAWRLWVESGGDVAGVRDRRADRGRMLADDWDAAGPVAAAEDYSAVHSAVRRGH